MAAFRFRLAPVLRYRERLREETRLEFAALDEARARLAQTISEMESRLFQAKELGGADRNTLESAELRLYGDFVQQAERKIHEQRERLAALEQALEEKRAAVLQANREVKSLEQLKGRLQERHRREVNADEQKRTDEVGQRRYRGSGG
jgi:flagellar FliJ protein